MITAARLNDVHDALTSALALVSEYLDAQRGTAPAPVVIPEHVLDEDNKSPRVDSDGDLWEWSTITEHWECYAEGVDEPSLVSIAATWGGPLAFAPRSVVARVTPADFAEPEPAPVDLVRELLEGITGTEPASPWPAPAPELDDADKRPRVDRFGDWWDWDLELDGKWKCRRHPASATTIGGVSVAFGPLRFFAV